MVHLMPLGHNDPVYREAERMFRNGWQHYDKTYHLEGIFYINHAGPVAQQHLARNSAYSQQVQRHTAGQAVRYLFHGTKRACHIGDDRSQIVPCNLGDCNFCQILKLSFRLPRAGDDGMFGAGIYTSSISSKADGYAKNHHIRSRKHAMFLSHVVTGNSQRVTRAENWRRAPDPGYDSVEAVPKVHGGAVRYPETVVYREDAILPAVVIIYTRHN